MDTALSPCKFPLSRRKSSPFGSRIFNERPWRIYVMNTDGSQQRPMFGAKLDGLGIRYEWATERVISWSR